VLVMRIARGESEDASPALCRLVRDFDA
jgi:hypothetical protein